MRERIFWLVVTFHTTAAAMAMEALCKEQSLPGRLFPRPGSLPRTAAWRGGRRRKRRNRCGPWRRRGSLTARNGGRYCFEFAVRFYCIKKRPLTRYSCQGTFFILQEICGELVRFWQSGQMPSTTSRWPSTR